MKVNSQKTAHPSARSSHAASSSGAPTFIDLFCGCGGFTLGLTRSGFRCLAAVDFNHEAIEVFRANIQSVPHVLQKDLTEFSPKDLEALIGVSQVDLIVGGPPCQGFSTARQVDGANHGERLKEDSRRHLYKEFLAHVKHFKPKVFVMENVLGIRSASGGHYFTKVQADARALGYRVHAQVEDCVDLGVPQKRRRQLFIGTRQELPFYFRPTLQPAGRAQVGTTLWDAIGDLPPLKAGTGDEVCDYDLGKRAEALRRSQARNYMLNVLEVAQARTLTAHRARPHSARDLRDFKRLKEGESSAEAMRRGIKFEFPYAKTSFKDRYTRQHRHRPCSTIVAHLAKDGLMFIHPTQNRTLTPREAARVQSFPDWFQFPVARTHQFRVIGNAVPPLVSEAIGIAVKTYLSDLITRRPSTRLKRTPLPSSPIEAVRWITNVADLTPKEIRKVSASDLKRAWFSVLFLFMGLHPDSALDHGEAIVERDVTDTGIGAIHPLLQTPYYEQSGWPVYLENLAAEAWRRFEIGQISEDEFYCSDAQIAGRRFRNATLPKPAS